jgi:hypothetical protein
LKVVLDIVKTKDKDCRLYKRFSIKLPGETAMENPDAAVFKHK